MKLRTVALIVFLTIVAVAATAQNAATPVGNTDQSELAKFQKFIANHPKALAELQKDPSLISSPEFIKRHPRVGDYITKHPNLKNEVKANPKAFADIKPTREGGQNRHGHQQGGNKNP